LRGRDRPPSIDPRCAAPSADQNITGLQTRYNDAGVRVRQGEGEKKTGISARIRSQSFDGRIVDMELAIQIQVEELPEGLFLATSDELPGLVAQGRTVAEALEIARDVARKLIEARRERDGVPNLPTTSERRDYTIVVAA
jgi:predicted RNase H-like HicB family nuclease